RRARAGGIPLRQVLFAFVLLAGRAAADETADVTAARELFERAEVQYTLRHWDAALALYEQAYERKPLPGFLFNIGQCHRQLGHLRRRRPCTVAGTCGRRSRAGRCSRASASRSASRRRTVTCSRRGRSARSTAGARDEARLDARAVARALDCRRGLPGRADLA